MPFSTVVVFRLTSLLSFVENLHFFQSEDLLREHLQVNELLARLRKQALQGPAARGELEEAGKAAEREKAALAKWRKTKTQQAGIHSSSKNGSGTTGIAMKAKSSHKKKLGSY